MQLLLYARYTDGSDIRDWPSDSLKKRDTEALVGAPVSRAMNRNQKPKLVDEVNSFLDMAMCFFDVFEGPRLQTLSVGVVLFLGYVTAGAIEKFDCAVQTPAPLHVVVHRRMVVEVLAVVDGSLLNLVDRSVDFVNGFAFLLAEFAAVGALQMSARYAQIRKRVQIARMLAW